MSNNDIPQFDERLAYIEQIRARLLKVAENEEGPQYVYDEKQAKLNLSILKELGNFKIFYAVKSNPYKRLLKTFVDGGIGLDVSSELEFIRALEAGATQIVATGPGKSNAFLDLVFEHRQKVFLQLDSLEELKRVSARAANLGIKMECGVRVIADPNSAWNKFGVPIKELEHFFGDPNVIITGFHCHQSYNRSATAYCNFFSHLIDWAKSELNETQRNQIKWVDIGGGFVPPYFEGLYAWNKNLRMLFDTSSIVPKILADEYKPNHVVESIPPLSKIFEKILLKWRKLVQPIFNNAELFIEPGRILSYSTMHILLRVMDKKSETAVILNGGTNIIGYERYQYMSYVPTFNLSRFSKSQEQPMLLYGSLCTPDDIWGYYYYGSSIEIGDVLVMPFQGDYTFTCAQPNFIFPIPTVNLLADAPA